MRKEAGGGKLHRGIIAGFVIAGLFAGGLFVMTFTSYQHYSTDENREVPPPIIFVPKKVMFWNLARGKDHFRTIFLRQGDEHELVLKGITTDNPLLNAEVINRGGRERKTYYLRVTLSKEAPPGPVSGVITIETDHPEMKTIRVPVVGNVLNGLVVSPSALLLRIRRSTREASGRIELLSTREDSFNILKVNSSLRNLRADIKPLSNKRGYLLNVLITDPDRVLKGITDAVIHIETDFKPQRLIVVPVGIVSP